MCIASCTIIAEKPIETKNMVELNPSVSPTAVHSALTNAECALGMPPSSKKAFFLLEIIILMPWHNNQAHRILIRINFMQVLLLRPLQNSLALLFLR